MIRKTGSIFVGVKRADWARGYNRPKIDPFGNKVTPRWMYYRRLKSRLPIFEKATDKPSPADNFISNCHRKFVQKYIKPTRFSIFWTNVSFTALIDLNIIITFFRAR